MEPKAKRIILTILTVVVLGPLVFFGTCFPIGLLTFDSNAVIWAFVAGAVLAILVVYLVIKRIFRKRTVGVENARQPLATTTN